MQASPWLIVTLWAACSGVSHGDDQMTAVSARGLADTIALVEPEDTWASLQALGVELTCSDLEWKPLAGGSALSVGESRRRVNCPGTGPCFRSGMGESEGLSARCPANMPT